MHELNNVPIYIGPFSNLTMPTHSTKVDRSCLNNAEKMRNILNNFE